MSLHVSFDLLVLFVDLQKWSVYGGQRYLSLCNDPANTGICLREFVFLRDKKVL